MVSAMCRMAYGRTRQALYSEINTYQALRLQVCATMPGLRYMQKIGLKCSVINVGDTNAVMDDFPKILI